MSTTTGKTRQTEDRDTRGFLDVTVDRPDQHTVVLTVGGEVDLLTVPRLTDLVKQRLFAEIRTVVVDLSQVTFFGSCGVQLLCEAQQHADDRHIDLYVVMVHGGQVERVLHLTGVDHRFVRYGSKEEALSVTAPASAAQA